MVFLDSQGPKVSPLVGYIVSFTLDSQAYSSKVLRFYEVSDAKKTSKLLPVRSSITTSTNKKQSCNHAGLKNSTCYKEHTFGAKRDVVSLASHFFITSVVLDIELPISCLGLGCFQSPHALVSNRAVVGLAGPRCKSIMFCGSLKRSNASARQTDLLELPPVTMVHTWTMHQS